MDFGSGIGVFPLGIRRATVKIGWLYRLASVYVLALLLNNAVIAAEWAIYKDGFQIPPFVGSQSKPYAGTDATRITPHSLLMRYGDSQVALKDTRLVHRQITEFGVYSGKLSDGLEPQASQLDGLLESGGVFVRLRF